MTNLRTKLAVLVCFAAFATASSAAETPAPNSSPPNPAATAPMPMDHGKMGGAMNPGGGDMSGMQGMSGMSGMMDMMRSCQSMMNSPHEVGQTQMPKMPPGNEKAEFEMRAEILQKTGEIALKYAERIKVKP